VLRFGLCLKVENSLTQTAVDMAYYMISYIQQIADVQNKENAFKFCHSLLKSSSQLQQVRLTVTAPPAILIVMLNVNLRLNPHPPPVSVILR